MTDYLFPPPAQASLPVSTGAQRFAIRRVFCVDATTLPTRAKWLRIRIASRILGNTDTDKLPCRLEGKCCNLGVRLV